MINRLWWSLCKFDSLWNVSYLYWNFRGFWVYLIHIWITVISVLLHLHQNMVGINRLCGLENMIVKKIGINLPTLIDTLMGILPGIVPFSFSSSELWVNHVTSCFKPALCCNSLNQMGNLNAWLLGKLDLILCEEPSIPKIVVGMAQQHSKLSTKYWLYLCKKGKCLFLLLWYFWNYSVCKW